MNWKREIVVFAGYALLGIGGFFLALVIKSKALFLVILVTIVIIWILMLYLVEKNTRK